MNRTTLSSKTQRMPVLDILPVAYWVGGDTGMKQTTQQQWKNIVMVVEELACLVPIPEAYLDDADVPLWGQVQPRITEAVGALIDSAVQEYDTALTHTRTRKEELMARQTELAKVTPDNPDAVASSELLANEYLQQLRTQYRDAFQIRQTLIAEGKPAKAAHTSTAGMQNR